MQALFLLDARAENAYTWFWGLVERRAGHTRTPTAGVCTLCCCSPLHCSPWAPFGDAGVATRVVWGVAVSEDTRIQGGNTGLRRRGQTHARMITSPGQRPRLGPEGCLCPRSCDGLPRAPACGVLPCRPRSARCVAEGSRRRHRPCRGCSLCAPAGAAGARAGHQHDPRARPHHHERPGAAQHHRRAAGRGQEPGGRLPADAGALFVGVGARARGEGGGSHACAQGHASMRAAESHACNGMFVQGDRRRSLAHACTLHQSKQPLDLQARCTAQPCVYVRMRMRAP